MLASVTAVAAQPADTGAEDNRVETIIVTAQKVEQNLQDVPVSVTAVSGKLLQDTGANDIKGLTLLTPGLTVTSTGSEGSTTARIRGIGTVGDNPGLESSVGIVIDGVYRPRNGVGFNDLGEVDRIEILKGPQGTLFGKNADAGVINILTAKPTQDFSVAANATAGNFSDREGSVSLNGPLVADKLSGRLYVGAGQRDGFLDVNNGVGPESRDQTNNRKFETARGQLLFTPSDDIDVRFIADYTKRNESCCGAVQRSDSPTEAIINALSPTGGVAPSADPFARQAFANQRIDQQIRDGGASIELNWKLGAPTLTFIGAWRDWRISGANDVDYSGADIFFAGDGSNRTRFKQTSAELRLAGDTGTLNWLVGAFYAHENLDTQTALPTGAAFEPFLSLVASGGTDPIFLSHITGLAPGTIYPGGYGEDDHHSQVSNSYALFTNETYKVNDVIDLSLGLRYTKDQKDVDSVYKTVGSNGFANGCGAVLSSPAFATLPAASQAALVGIGCFTGFSPLFNGFTNSQSFDDNNTSGTAKAIFHVNDQLMTYLSYGRGYKAGGFNLDRATLATTVPPPAGQPALPIGYPNADTSFGAETVDAYELGAKSTLAGGSLLLDGAVFDQKYKDFQLNTFTGIQFVVSSLPKVESRGVDVDAIWSTPVHGLSFQGGVTYADTKIKDFGTNGALFDANRENDRISFAPLWSATASDTYAVPLASALMLRTNVGVKYNSEYNTGSDLNPAKIQGGYALVNARIGVGAPDDRWVVELWGRNLTDKNYYQVVFDAPFQHFGAPFPDSNGLDAYLGDPRTYGVTFRIKM